MSKTKINLKSGPQASGESSLRIGQGDRLREVGPKGQIGTAIVKPVTQHGVTGMPGSGKPSPTKLGGK